jgi:hypothetical protein
MSYAVPLWGHRAGRVTFGAAVGWGEQKSAPLVNWRYAWGVAANKSGAKWLTATIFFQWDY